MDFLWLLNLTFLAFPTAITLGVLVITQPFTYTPPNVFSYASSGVTTKQFCQQYIEVSPPSIGEHYTLNPNQWGWSKGDDGSLCLNVTAINNGTYATKATAPKFSATWQYPQAPNTQKVWAFPNIRVNDSILPITLRHLDRINLNMQWTYGVGDKAAQSTNKTILAKNLVNTNVAIDMFLDTNMTRAQNVSVARHEVMIWFGAFGSARPTGFLDGAVTTTKLKGITYTLYFAFNKLGQGTSTWLASETIDKFDGDIAPLLTKLTQLNHPSLPSLSDTLGYLSLGSETYSAKKPATFFVPHLSIVIKPSNGTRHK
ncbi:concanavalin A-like lectin/glucanase [Thozetella sp. PMI_491]|nr:concanavalin A-like lectin/glucanase [Thozetella sp. PMI_491]